MLRVTSLVAGVSTLLVASTFASSARAVTCASRPTDAGGYVGYTYGTDEVKTFDGTKVRVHYALTGTHAVVTDSTRADLVPDTVALTADIGDTSLTKYAAMGFEPPPSDAACDSNGGDARLDIYLVKFSSGADGTTAKAGCTGRVCSTFVLAESSFVGRGYPTVAEGFRTVIAHELFHTVQNAYDAGLDSFWAEGTAQWAMKTVYPELVDFERQLPAYFKENKRSIDASPAGVTAGFLYGSSVFPLYLTLHHGPDTVRKVFENEADGSSAIVAVGKALDGLGSSLAASMPLYGAWNASTKDLAAADGYPDAAKYPGITADTLVDGASAVTSGLPYYVYRGTLDARSLVSLETDATRNAGVLVPIEGGKPVLGKAKALPVNAAGDVLVVVSGISPKKTDAPYVLHLGEPDPSLDGPDGGDGDVDAGGDDGRIVGNGTNSDGGCAVTPASNASPTLPALGAIGLALGGLAFVRGRAGRRGRAARG